VPPACDFGSLGAIGIIGAGRQALETSGYCLEAGLTTAFFVEERPPTESRDLAAFGSPILTFESVAEEHLATPVISAVGLPELRRRLVGRWHGDRFVTVISAHAWLAADAAVGRGTTVAPGAALNRLVRVGAHVLVNVGVILSHDVTIDDFVTLSPGCAIGGLVSIGVGTFVGIGATVRDRVRIGKGAVVAAGAVVVADVADGETVRGVPARPVSAS